jgi:queuine tRNA-ribosyltransferase
MKTKTIQTSHGELTTPFFMPDATRASIKAMPLEHVAGVGIEALCMNTYHLMLRPGVEVVRAAGGLHAFSGWDGPILTDSGGYQVFSLIHKNPKLGKVTEEGAKFRDVYSGAWRMLTPELSVQIQCDLGVDMMVILDDVRPNDRAKEELNEAVDRTLRWARRAWVEYQKQAAARQWTEQSRPKIFAVIQGGPHLDLRKKCIDGLKEIAPWDGYGFGGLHIAPDGRLMEDLVKGVADMIPDDALKFALGVGKPSDIETFVQYGWDMFDCTIPSRDGRHGKAFIQKGESITSENIGTAENTLSQKSLEEGCQCGCSAYTRSYLRHLLQVHDPVAGTVIMRHNLHSYARLLQRLRQDIVAGSS